MRVVLGEGCFLEQVAGYFKVRVVLGEGCFLEQVAGYFKVKVASWSRLQVAGFKGAGCHLLENSEVFYFL